MSKHQLTEERLREIIQEEYISENLYTLVESHDLFEAKKGGKTKAEQILTPDVLNMLATAEGRKTIANLYRLPLVLAEIPEKMGTKIGKLGKKSGFFSNLMGGLGWLTSGPFKLIAKPVAWAGKKIGNMDDQAAKMIVAFMQGEMPAEPDTKPVTPAEEPTPVTSDEQPEMTLREKLIKKVKDSWGLSDEDAERYVDDVLEKKAADHKKKNISVGQNYFYTTKSGKKSIVNVADLTPGSPGHVSVRRVKNDQPFGSPFGAKVDSLSS